MLATDVLVGDYKRRQARGVRFSGGIEHAPWGSFATFDDPDGN